MAAPRAELARAAGEEVGEHDKIIGLRREAAKAVVLAQEPDQLWRRAIVS
eukprot:COSAG02_NODE_41593_length_393_cov_0.602041_1_plen_49_part_01